MKKLFLENAKTILLAIILSSGLSIASAWTGPTTTAPGGNVSTPINVGNSVQIKLGGFWADALGTTNGVLSTGNVSLTNVQSTVTVDSRSYQRTDSDLSNNPPLTPKCVGDTTDNRDNLPDSNTNPSVGAIGSTCYDYWLDTANNNYPRADRYVVVSQTAGGTSFSARPQLTFTDTATPSWNYSVKNVSGVLKFYNGAGVAKFSIDQNGNMKIGGTLTQNVSGAPLYSIPAYCNGAGGQTTNSTCLAAQCKVTYSNPCLQYTCSNGAKVTSFFGCPKGTSYTCTTLTPTYYYYDCNLNSCSHMSYGQPTCANTPINNSI